MNCFKCYKCNKCIRPGKKYGFKKEILFCDEHYTMDEVEPSILISDNNYFSNKIYEKHNMINGKLETFIKYVVCVHVCKFHTF